MNIRTADVEPGTGLLKLRFNADDRREWFNLLALVKSFPGRRFISAQKLWIVPDKENVREKLLKHGFNIQDKAPITMENDNWQEPWRDIKLPISTPAFLRPYQEECLKFLIHRQGRGLIADPMGAGKTIEALGFLKTFYEKSIPVLIITLANIKIQWRNQFKRFMGNDYSIQILSGQTPYPLWENSSFIINWDILKFWLPQLLKYNFKTVIADEFHKSYTTKAKRTKAFITLGRKFPFLLPISGTPIKSKPVQFFPVLHLLAPDIFRSEQDFKLKYCDPKWNGFGWDYNGASNIPELFKIIRNLMIRRSKESILPDLPEKERTVIPLEITKTKKYDEYSRLFLESKKGVDEESSFHNLRLEIFDMKKKAIEDWLRNFIESEEKILVGTYHQIVIKYLHELFKNESEMIYGAVTGNRRERAIQNFINNPEIKILFLQIEGGVGIDGFQEVCNNCAFVEFTEIPTDHEQFEDRLHRDGQKNFVSCYYLIGEGTLEEKMMKLMEKRAKTVDGIYTGNISDEIRFIDYLKREK